MVIPILTWGAGIVAIDEVEAKSVLSRSSIAEYCVNPYVGCQHACVYCYAQWYAKQRGIREEWGSYVRVRVNAPQVLAGELRRKRRGEVLLSSMTDPYQPVEARYGLTRKVLQLLRASRWPAIILTKSPLVLRDIDVLSSMEATVGMTIITLDESVASALESGAPPPSARIDALAELKSEGLPTYAFVGPIIPGTPIEELLELVRVLEGSVDMIYFDRLNLKPGLAQKLDPVFEELGIEGWKTWMGEYYRRLKGELAEKLEGAPIRVEFVY